MLLLKRARLSPGPQAAASTDEAVPVPPALPGETWPETRGALGSGGVGVRLRVSGLFALSRARRAQMRRESERCQLGALSLSLNKYDFVRFMKNNIVCYFS